jgi:hypothetical protein
MESLSTKKLVVATVVVVNALYLVGDALFVGKFCP